VRDVNPYLSSLHVPRDKHRLGLLTYTSSFLYISLSFPSFLQLLPVLTLLISQLTQFLSQRWENQASARVLEKGSEESKNIKEKRKSKREGGDSWPI